MRDIVAYIQDFRDSNPTGWRKWIVGSLVFVLTVVVITVLVIRETQRGKELAKLYGERDKAKEELHRSKLDQKLSKNAEDKARHAELAEAALQRAAEIEEQIQQIEDLHKKNIAVIDSIKSWEDVDKRVR